MAITITPPLPTPTNVVATAVSGGTLVASVTYYVVVCASNSNLTYNTTNTSVTSDASVEVSVNTTASNRSITVTWDAVAGATHYNVYISRNSGNYSSTVTHCAPSNGVATTTGLTWTQTAPCSNYYSPDTIVSGIALPFNINKNKGSCQVVISATGGTLTLANIVTELTSAGLTDYFYCDANYNNFALKGSITISAATTGSLIISDCNIIFIKGAFLNSSTSFTMQLGLFVPASKRWYSPCSYCPTLVSTNLANMSIYGAKVRQIAFLTSYTHIGTEIINMNTNVVDCVFDGLRNTSTDWSNNKIANFSLLRAWQSFQTTNAYYEVPVNVEMYGPNGSPSFRDCTFKGDSTTDIFRMGNDASLTPRVSSKLYDCIFVGEYYNSIDDLIFTFTTNWGGLAGYDFYYSLQGVVQDENGDPINGVNIDIYDKDMNLVHNLTTASDIIPKTDIRVMNILPTGAGTGPSYYTRTYYSPFTFVYSKQGYQSYTTKIALTNKLDTVVTLNPVYISLSNLVSNSTVQIYDITETTELYNGVVAGTTLDLAYTGVFDDSIRIRVRKIGYTPYEYIGPITTTGITLALAQELDMIYASNAIDGSTVTEFDFNTGVIEIDDPTGTTTAQRLYNWYNYAISITTHIGDHDNLILAQTSWSYIIDDALLLKNVDTAVLFIEGANINNTTGDGAVIDTSGGNININGYFPFNSAGAIGEAVWNDTLTYGAGTKGKKLKDGFTVADSQALL